MTTRLIALWFGCALLAGGLGACSLYLDWDPAGLPCDSESKCADGYSCLVNRCIDELSLAKGDTCSEPEQCEGHPQITCGSNPFTCRTTCSSLFRPTGNCEAAEYCRPERARLEDENDPPYWVGTCFPSMCVRDQDCTGDRVCVPIAGDAGACLVPCEYEFTTGTYDDKCVSTDETEQYCQLIGKEGGEQLVCLEALGTPRQGPGAPCDPVESPCESNGLVCIDGICERLCSAAVPLSCPQTNQICQTVEESPGVPLYAICVDQ